MLGTNVCQQQIQKETRKNQYVCDLNAICSPQIQLSVSTSALSDGFSLDTVGSYGCVRCPASTLDYLVTPYTSPPYT